MNEQACQRYIGQDAKHTKGNNEFSNATTASQERENLVDQTRTA